MPSMTDVNFNNPALLTMLKGEPGTWKSSTAVTYPGNQYWFSFDRKMRALLLPMKKHNIDSKLIHYDDYATWTMNNGNNPSALKKLEQFIISCPYKNVIFDSITTIADSMLRQILENKVGMKRKGGADAGKTIGGIDVNELEDFNGEAAGINELLALAMDLKQLRNVNVIFIAHVIRIESKDVSGKTTISRSIVTAARKPAAKVPAICEEIYHFNVKPAMVVGQNSGIEVFTKNTSEDYARTTLPLNGTLALGEDINFYQQYIQPAIDKMK